MLLGKKQKKKEQRRRNQSAFGLRRCLRPPTARVDDGHGQFGGVAERALALAQRGGHQQAWQRTKNPIKNREPIVERWEKNETIASKMAESLAFDWL